MAFNPASSNVNLVQSENGCQKQESLKGEKDDTDAAHDEMAARRLFLKEDNCSLQKS